MGERRLTEWVRELGLTAPLICAPMGGVAGGALATAVSRAGALGMIGMGSAGSVAALERELAELGDDLRGADGLPFGIGLVEWGIARDPELLSRAIAAAPVLLSVSFGDWNAPALAPHWVTAARDAGILTVTQVATVQEAEVAAASGVDAIVARGSEGGGHGDHREPRDSLLAAVLGAVDVPVIAAGAVSSAADVARVLDAGAVAAWVGTAFAAAEEALTSVDARAALIAATGADTVVTRAYDVALERPWPARFPERLVRTEFIDRWHGRETELALDTEARAAFRAAAAAGDYSVVPVDAGEGVGLVTRVRPAAEVVADLT